jgi:hypothetical protein
MINFSEIQPGDLIRVLLNIDDVDDEIYAITKENRDDYLIVNYYLETSFVYKGARVYELDDNEELVQQENLCEHFPEGESIFKRVDDMLYCIDDEIESDIESVFIDESDEESDLEGFIVPDDEIDGEVIPPVGHKEIDQEWADWEPRSPGSRRFKELVDSIEGFARMHADNLNF